MLYCCIICLINFPLVAMSREVAAFSNFWLVVYIFNKNRFSFILLYGWTENKSSMGVPQRMQSAIFVDCLTDTMKHCSNTCIQIFLSEYFWILSESNI